MCLIVLAINAHAEYPLIIAANRDEYFDRPTDPLHAWPNSPIIAGRDKQMGGTWLGVTRGGKTALVTNFRGPGEADPKPRSRGALVSEFLSNADSPAKYCQKLAPNADKYKGYNLIVGHGDDFFYTSNRSKSPTQKLEDGVHVLSNHLLNTPWPKVSALKAATTQAIGNSASPQEKAATTPPIDPHAPLIQALLYALFSKEKAPINALPDTGISIERERQLSSAFVRLEQENYGTRSSTILIRNTAGKTIILERTWSLASSGPEDFTEEKIITFDGGFRP